MFRILIVEDNQSYRESLKEILGDKLPNIVVEEAANGKGQWKKLIPSAPILFFIVSFAKGF